MSSPTDLGGEPDPANGPENSEEPQHTPAEHEATETAAVFFTPALPPPIPRRPSAVGRAKLRKSLQVADSTGGEEAKQAPDVAVAKNKKASLPQTREDMRKIYFGNTLLLFASTEKGGYFLGSDKSGYVVLSETPHPTCFTNMNTVPYLRYGDTVRVNSGHCGMHGHASNSWMSWGEDVSKTSGLFTISLPDFLNEKGGGDILMPSEIQFGKPLEYGSPFMLLSSKWKTNVVGMAMHKNVKHLALNEPAKTWLEPLIFMCQVYKPPSVRRVLQPTKPSAGLQSNVAAKSSPDKVAETQQKKSSGGPPNPETKTEEQREVLKAKASSAVAAEKKAALNFSIGNVREIQKRLIGRAAAKKSSWNTSLKKALESKLAEKTSAIKILEQEMNELTENDNHAEVVADSVSPSPPVANTRDAGELRDLGKNRPGPKEEDEDLFLVPVEPTVQQSSSAEFVQIEKMVNEARADLGKIKLKLYCPSALGFRYKFQAYGYFCGMEDYAFEQLSIPFTVSLKSANETTPACIILQFSPVTITWKAFGLKLVTESNRGVKQSSRDFKELTINATMVLNAVLYFTTDNDFAHNGMRPDNNKKGVSEKTKEPSAAPEYSWYCQDFKFEVTKTMNERGVEGGMIPTLVKKVANYYLPKLVKENLLWYVTDPLGDFLRNTRGQSFHAEGKLDVSGTRLDVLKAKFSSTKWGLGSGNKNTKSNEHNNPTALAMALLGGIAPAQAEMLRKMRDVVGKTHGEGWETRWDSLHSLKSYVRHMHNLMKVPEEWGVLTTAWQTLADNLYPPSFANGPRVLNVNDILNRVKHLTMKPVEVSWSIRSMNFKFDFNQLTIMQKEVAEWAIHQSMNVANEKGEMKARWKTTQGMLALREVAKWHAERLGTIDVLSTVLPRGSASLAVTLSGGSKGVLSIYSKSIDARVPQQLQLQLGKAVMAPSMDSTVLAVSRQNHGGRYSIEYCSPIEVAGTERAVSTTSDPNASKVIRRESFSDYSWSDDLFGESSEIPGHTRVLIISWKDIDMQVRLDKNILLRRLLDAETSPKTDVEQLFLLNHVRFALDEKDQETFRFSAVCPENSLVDVAINELQITGSPARITQYYKETMRKARLAEAEIFKKTSVKDNSSFGGDPKPDAATSGADEWYQNLLSTIEKYASSSALSLHLFADFSLAQDADDGHIHIVIEGKERHKAQGMNSTISSNTRPTAGFVANTNIALCIEEVIQDFGLRDSEQEV